VPALVEVLVKVTERRRVRSVWKFRPCSREMEMDRNVVEAIRRGCCVKPPDIVNREVSALTIRRCNLSESCTHTTRSQIWDGGETVKLQHGACPEVTKCSVEESIERSRKLMAYLGQGEDLAICGRRGDPHPWSNY
jgi:hypothetical protein